MSPETEAAFDTVGKLLVQLTERQTATSTLIGQVAQLQKEHEEANQREFELVRQEFGLVRQELAELRQIADSNARSIQAISQQD
ncbi:hypothetical protein [Synechococcus sp. PCC 7336]|uniref:hypothetical protein n=1 Tax=Synechococcus sp. PCC 7336 TaxID=195250 RepID=UPI000349B02E|nr:hypothetical protein [Synechococcus sp. PCC 7336]